MPAASDAMPQEHVEDLLRISCEAAARLKEVRAECQEIDRAMMIVLERQALLPDPTNSIFPPATSSGRENPCSNRLAILHGRRGAALP